MPLLPLWIRQFSAHSNCQSQNPLYKYSYSIVNIHPVNSLQAIDSTCQIHRHSQSWLRSGHRLSPPEADPFLSFLRPLLRSISSISILRRLIDSIPPTMAHPTLLSRAPSFLAPSRRCLFSPPASSAVASQSRQVHLRLSNTTSKTLKTKTNSSSSRHQSRLAPFNCSSPLRSYHSQHHPDPPVHEYTNSQTTILSAALRHIPQHGFTRDALTLGARDAGFLDVSIQLFPRAEFDLILFWLASRRGLLRASVDDGLLRPYADASVEEKIKVLLMERLRMNVDIRHQWQDVRSLSCLSS